MKIYLDKLRSYNSCTVSIERAIGHRCFYFPTASRRLPDCLFHATSLGGNHRKIQSGKYGKIHHQRVGWLTFIKKKRRKVPKASEINKVFKRENNNCWSVEEFWRRFICRQYNNGLTRCENVNVILCVC